MKFKKLLLFSVLAAIPILVALIAVLLGIESLMFSQNQMILPAVVLLVFLVISAVVLSL